MMEYNGRWLPSAEYEGKAVLETYPHDPDTLPHQHDKLEELFPPAYVPYPSDRDEVVSGPDELEKRGESLDAEKETYRRSTSQ